MVSKKRFWPRMALILLGAVLAWPGMARGNERAEVFVQLGHIGNVLCAAVSPDGRHVLSGGREGALKLWEIGSGREIRTFIGHVAAVNAVAFLPEGKFALSGSSDTTLRLWDTATGETVRVLTGHFSSISAAAVSPDGRFALSAGLEETVVLWDLSTGLEIRRFEGHTDSVTAVKFAPDGKTALSAGDDGSLRLWDLAAGGEIRVMTGHTSGITGAAFSPDGRFIVSGGWDGSIRLWETADGREIAVLPGGGMIASVDFGLEGYVLAGGQDRTAKLWDVAKGSPVRTFSGHTGQVNVATFSPDGRFALTGSWDGTLRWWEISTGREVRSFEGTGAEVRTAALSGGGTTAVSGGGGTPVLWDIASGRGFRTLAGHTQGVNAVAFGPDGRTVLTAGNDGALILHDAESGLELRSFKGHIGSVESAAFTPDGQRIVSGSLDRTVKVWDAASGREIATFEGYRDSVDVLAISPDGRFMLTEDSPDFILQDLADGKEIRRFSGHGPGVEALAFSPDGKLILSGSFDRTMKLWDAADGKEIRTFTGHTDSVESVAFSPDGKLALSGSWDATVRLWDVATGGEVRIFRGHAGWVESVTFSRDGRLVLSGGVDGSSRVWDAAGGRELARFVGLAGGEWIVITPEGYYASSPNGHSSLNVRLGERVYGIDQFYDVFYRPDIVEHKLKGADIGPLVGLTIEDALKSPPPEARIEPLPAGTDAARITVEYRVESAGGGIGEVRVFHNGKLVRSDGFYRKAESKDAAGDGLDRVDGRAVYERQRDLNFDFKPEDRVAAPSKGNVYSDRVEIEAAPGENVIGVCAFNKDNTIQGYMRTAVFDGRRPAAEPELYILTVGIDEYEDSRANLSFAVKDARDTAERFEAAAGAIFRPENIHVEVLANAEAGKENILERVRELAETVEIGDMVVVFFAGHGLLRDEQYYFVTREYDGKIDERCLIGSNEIVDMSTRLKSLSQLFIFDSCHAGGVDYIIGGLYDARMSVMAKKLGLHVYASCSSLQTALDGYKGNGLFTYHLLAGLEGSPKIDLNTDSVVSVVELGAYLRDSTAEASRKLGHPQIPTIINFGRDIPLYKLR